ncbi:hypothetical protein PT974_08337 [Cladobotryum mycophilum]|uniref:Ubiquitin carboxyl-terminal hydrolase 19 n=1 Tax=Cladobotryum mycophilum TaxID=491253 RepID=A0ABR0SD43_9HYPO
MDPRFPVSREELYNLQMELKQLQYAQLNQGDRITKLEKRQVDDSALKSVWNSPFPGVLSGTPQHGGRSVSFSSARDILTETTSIGPVQIPQNDMFDDLDEQGEQLLGSLHLGPAEEEPVRRGAASRANSVRFDESALHGSSWGGQNNRHSGDFGQVRPGSGFMMERSLSHKSDGRHSSAGHSVYSHHSVASGRASSLGLDTNFATGDDDDDSSFDMPGLPASLYVLGTVPSIVRCWLTTNYAHGTLLYADVCTGSQKSTIEYALVKELDLLDEFQRDVNGIYRARLDVYLAEAVITRHCSRSETAEGSVPSMTVCFEMIGGEQPQPGSQFKGVRIFIGSDALRAHSTDVLFSQNSMVLYSNERDRLRVPFVRPEDEDVFRNICTNNMTREKPKLNATAAPFILGETNQGNDEKAVGTPSEGPDDNESREAVSPPTLHSEPLRRVRMSNVPDNDEDAEKPAGEAVESERRGRDGSSASETSRREPSSGIWGSWRNGGANGADGQREGGPISGYQPAARGRNMKVLKPLKSGSSSARTGATYEPPPPPPPKSSEGRRKSQVSTSGESTTNGVNRWDTKKTPPSTTESRPQSSSRDGRAVSMSSLPRSANPVGVASAFSWMTPNPKSAKSSTAAAE